MWQRPFVNLFPCFTPGKSQRQTFQKVREKGARLKTLGHRAAGPEAFKDLFDYIAKKFQLAAGRRLYPVECHDIICKIASLAGHRRAATISLSDPNDTMMRDCKSFYKVKEFIYRDKKEFDGPNGKKITLWDYSITYVDLNGEDRSDHFSLAKDELNNLLVKKKLAWYHVAPERRFANNSVAYDEKPSVSEFMDEWKALYESGSGERGIFNRSGIPAHLAKNSPLRDAINYLFGTNPCGEIILRPRGLCNLTEVVVRPR